jgi:FixJ family two-component response regulator
VSARSKECTKADLVAVIDDDEDVRVALDGLLDSLGYRSVLFESADSFLAADDTGDIDCIISDVQMPGTSGLVLAERVQSRTTPVILITAYPTVAVRKRAEAAGVRCLLVKPFDSEKLIEQLEMSLA